jgi:hypothetical protein
MFDTEHVQKVHEIPFARFNETFGCLNWKVSCSVFSVNGQLFFEMTLQLINNVFALCALHCACQSISTTNKAPALGSHRFRGSLPSCKKLQKNCKMFDRAYADFKQG